MRYDISVNTKLDEIAKGVENNHYSSPSRTLIVKEVQKVLIELKARIGTFLHEARKISICGDVWSKEGLTSSYLGIMGHFFLKKRPSQALCHTCCANEGVRSHRTLHQKDCG